MWVKKDHGMDAMKAALFKGTFFVAPSGVIFMHQGYPLFPQGQTMRGGGGFF